MPIVKLFHKFSPRPYQKALIKAVLVDGIKRVLFIAHRRSGKDLTCLNLVIALACQRVGSHLYALPMQTQAKKVIWSAMTKDGTRFIDRIPKELIAKINNTDMSVTLINGSRIIFSGTDNLDGLIGTNFITIVLSEFSLHSPMVLPLLSPILRENGGVLILNMTPRGTNHAYDLYQAVKNNPDWYVRILGVNDTTDNFGNPILTEDDINQERASGVDEHLIQQEFYVSWNSGNIGAYYTHELEQLEREGRLMQIKPTIRPVWVFMDIGFDATSCCMIQPNGKYLDVIATAEWIDKDMKFVINSIREIAKQLNITFKDWIGPHDLRQREWAGGRTRMDLARDMGINFRVAPKVSIDDGIQAVKAIFPKLRFDSGRCHMGLQSLREYRREYNSELKIFKQTPLHSWASHFADALRYFAVYWQDLYMRPTADGSIKYNVESLSMNRNFDIKQVEDSKLQGALTGAAHGAVKVGQVADTGVVNTKT